MKILNVDTNTYPATDSPQCCRGQGEAVSGSVERVQLGPDHVPIERVWSRSWTQTVFLVAFGTRTGVRVQKADVVGVARTQIDKIFSGTQHPAFLCQDFIERNIQGVIMPVVATEVPDKRLMILTRFTHVTFISESEVSK